MPDNRYELFNFDNNAALKETDVALGFFIHFVYLINVTIQ